MTRDCETIYREKVSTTIKLKLRNKSTESELIKPIWSDQRKAGGAGKRGAARRWPAAGRRRSLRSHRRQLSGSGEAAAGTVEGVFVFHRHGDRSPAKRLVGDSYADAEEEYWRSRVPPGPSLHDALSALYPAEIHLSNNAGKFFDTRREPYGFLTWAGMEQMRLSGRRCAQRQQ